jgi:chemotaxis signal transduction protein
MRSDPSADSPRLMQFRTPGLPQTVLAVMLPEVLAVTKLRSVMPVPFSRRFVLGLSEWDNRLITVIDLAAALSGTCATSNGSIPDSNGCYLVAQVVVDNQIDVIAWPILLGAEIPTIPSQAPQAEVPLQLFPAAIHCALDLDGQDVVLLDLGGMLTYLSWGTN